MLDALVDRHERLLGSVLLVLGGLVWAGLVAVTLGGVLLWVAAAGLVYLFAQSAVIAHVRGNGIEVSESQMADLHQQFLECCRKLEIQTPPRLYVVSGHGWMDAIALKFLGKTYLVLLSDTVDAMARHPEGVRFYLGHELGRLRMKHLHVGQQLRWPALWLPLLGPAYARAMATTCDLHGRACCATPESAVRALAALSAGAQRWATLDLPAYRRQSKLAPGFWMSFHELISGRPWLVNRAARVLEPDRVLPSRHPLAWGLAALVPYAGRAGGGIGLLAAIAVIGVVAAVAIPAYADYRAHAELAAVMNSTKSVRYQLAAHYKSSRAVPTSLQDIGVPATLPQGQALTLNPRNMVLTVRTSVGDLVWVPHVQATGDITWSCVAGEGLKPKLVPQQCKGATD